jgi:uncharacterized membrane protein
MRAKEVSRVEAFSDVVFGFALTLIVVSLEVPSTFDQLLLDMRGFLGFTICFALLVWIWYCHYIFFRRYDLTDDVTVVLNTVLLFIVLGYVYPLKFLFALLTGALNRHDAIRPGQIGTLMLIYGAGFAGIFLMLFLMHLHAYRRRDALALTAVELHDTKTQLWMHGSYVAIGLASIGIAVLAPPRFMSMAGWIYAVIGPLSATIGTAMGIKRQTVAAAMLETDAELTATAAT